MGSPLDIPWNACGISMGPGPGTGPGPSAGTISSYIPKGSLRGEAPHKLQVGDKPLRLLKLNLV